MHNHDTTRSLATQPSRQRDPLGRAVALLNVMVDADEQEFGVRQLAKDLGVSASTAHRLLADLEQLDLIAKSDDGLYRLGLGLFRLAMRVNARFPLRGLAQPYLKKLSQAVGESAFLGLYEEATQSMVFGATVESNHSLRYIVELNHRVPLHAGASGLAILAFLSDATTEEVLANPELAVVTQRTVTDRTQIRARLAEIRAKGYAMSRGERIAGALAIAAPILGPTGTAMGDIGVTMPESRFDPANEATIAEAVMATAAELTGRIQHGEGDTRPALRGLRS